MASLNQMKKNEGYSTFSLGFSIVSVIVGFICYLVVPQKVTFSLGNRN